MMVPRGNHFISNKESKANVRHQHHDGGHCHATAKDVATNLFPRLKAGEVDHQRSRDENVSVARYGTYVLRAFLSAGHNHPNRFLISSPATMVGRSARPLCMQVRFT